MSKVDSLSSSDFKILSNYPISAPTDKIVFGRNPRPTPFSLIQLTEEQRFAIQLAKKYALEQSIQNALRKQAVQHQQQDLNNIKRNHALILLSRIYVGSISFEIGDEDLKRTFSPFGPIKAVTLSWDATLQKHKGFAFIEYEVPEAASLALDQMNGYTLAGRNLKVAVIYIYRPCFDRFVVSTAHRF
ncbi:Poly(U)-binding-splicing factor PUF60 [Fasciolopsis buskii]|uniref:Poly(U)-binding-splicing factor PUF60 n=1 Tax=Fasciolopsis buskii TaxID=27845 RepID=A0A8E0RPE4_9TREM|nr:Poly(U)-binding-splicing factor PUF60 [Fasciolopsis buski]